MVLAQGFLESQSGCWQGFLLFCHSVVSDSLWPPWTATCQASLSFTVYWSLLKLMSVESVMPSSHLIFCHPVLSSIFPGIRVFSSASALHIRWLRYCSCSFSLSISPFNGYLGLISFRTDWQGLLSAKALISTGGRAPRWLTHLSVERVLSSWAPGCPYRLLKFFMTWQLVSTKLVFWVNEKERASRKMQSLLRPKSLLCGERFV